MNDGREKPTVPTSEQLEMMLAGSTWTERADLGLRARTWEDMNEEEREYCRKWLMGRLLSWEGVRMIAAYMDSKKEKVDE